MSPRFFSTILLLIINLYLGKALVSDVLNYDSIIFLDVGQGDATLLNICGQNILIDSGPGQKITESIESQGNIDRKIDLAILTHTEKDHIGGILPLYEKYEINNIAWNGRSPYEESTLWENILRNIEEKNTGLIKLEAGDKIACDDYKLEVLSPNKKRRESGFLNDGSLVLLLSHPKYPNILFMGDASKEVELEILKSFKFQAEIVKVGHHGSKTSSCKDFIDSVNPKTSIISVGQNTYGHPSPEVLENLKQTRVFRTDQNGNITIELKGLAKISTQK